MIRPIITAAFYLFSFGIAFAQTVEDIKENSVKHFLALEEAEWKRDFYDPCTQDWKESWVLDGLQATVSNTKGGMAFTAGPEAFNDAHHAVLWSKKDFKGDLKIEYEYTRLDKEVRMVNIIYIQATGSGKHGFDEDISTWADKRTVPSMRTYFNNMNTYHISYAAFGTKNKDATNDYIRARRYMCRALNGTELENEYMNTGFFATGVPHKITIIKSSRDVYMHIKNSQKEMLCHFLNTTFPPVTEGKIGLRHMYTRGALYKNFKVSVLAKNEPELTISNNH